ncbi:MAG: hypothetical protein ABSB10_09755 [Candidatus Bathyarchaeia archaeon]|jgi:hypothetical protein
MAGNDTKAEEKNIWKATKENVDNDFEETRRCLLNSYNANVQAHAGYIIALMIGFFAIITTFESFIKIIGGTIVFSILIIVIIVPSILITVRMYYWTIYVNTAILIPFDTALDYFNKYNNIKKSYYCKAPNTAIITCAIEKQIRYNFENYGSHKLALYLIRKVWKQLV